MSIADDLASSYADQATTLAAQDLEACGPLSATRTRRMRDESSDNHAAKHRTGRDAGGRPPRSVGLLTAALARRPAARNRKLRQTCRRPPHRRYVRVAQRRVSNHLDARVNQRHPHPHRAR